MGKKVPLVIHLTDGTKKVVGEAEVDDTGVFITGTITDSVLAKRFFGSMKGLSLDESAEPLRQNVFDQEKDT